jgi:IMP dehydrogenase
VIFADDREYLTFDDVSLMPQRSNLETRKQVNLFSGKLNLALPIISANMESVTWTGMAAQMAKLGGMGILHRFASEEEVKTACKELYGYIYGGSIGVKDYQDLLEIFADARTPVVCIDVAHGHHDKVFVVLEYIRKTYPNRFKVIAGNVVTRDAAIELADAGANIIKVGVGPGSHCTTRVVTGHGVPQLTAIADCADAKSLGAEIIADGGIRNSGDIAKAIAAGADYVMVGKLLAGCMESPGLTILTKEGICKQYMGSASFAAKSRHGNSKNVEGVASLIPATGPLEDTIEALADGLRSAYSYSGANYTEEFRKKARFIRISHASYVEGTPHGTL